MLERLPFVTGAQPGAWGALGLAAIAGIEILLASAALPLILTEHGRSEAAASAHHVWLICSVTVNALAASRSN